jgi:HSP20 family protein
VDPRGHGVRDERGSRALRRASRHREEYISLEFENNVLTLSGEKAEGRSEGGEGRRYYAVERSYRSFTRAFTLPRTVDRSNIVANFDKGVLTVTLPKSVEAKGRKKEDRDHCVGASRKNPVALSSGAVSTLG